MIRVADYIARTLAEHGIRHVFMVTGGGAMHLNDAIGRCEGLSYVCCHHEQACSMAADSYFRLSNRLAAVNVTTGPGGTNAITGVFGAWTDSLGMVVVSGQVKWETLVRSTDLPLRQLGDQEVDIIRLVEADDQVRRARHRPRIDPLPPRKGHPPGQDRPARPGLARRPHQHPGFHRRRVDAAGLRPERGPDRVRHQGPRRRLPRGPRPPQGGGAARHPGGGRASGSRGPTRPSSNWSRRWESRSRPPGTRTTSSPTTTPATWAGPGRSAIGRATSPSRTPTSSWSSAAGLNIRQVSYDWKKFARAAFKVMVDVDEAELRKPTLSIDLPIHADLGDFLPRLLDLAPRGDSARHDGWLAWCRRRLERYPTVLPEYWGLEEGVNPYCFARALFDQVPDDQVMVTGDGTACVVTFQGRRDQVGAEALHQLRLRLDGLRPPRPPSAPAWPTRAGRSSAWPATAASR